MTIAFVLLALAAGAVLIWLVSRRRRPEAPSSRPRIRLGTRLGRVFAQGLGDQTWRDLEAALITADVGSQMARRLVAAVQSEAPASPEEARACLRRVVAAVLGGRDRSLRVAGDPAVVMVVGVNGSGKTTTIAKLAALLGDQGTVLVAATDTYRAAATQQLEIWGERVGFGVVKGSDGSDPAAVAFDGLAAARSRGARALIVDTAGRLHSNRNLMDELSKVARVLQRAAGRIDEVLLVLDGTTGQNALAQARTFMEAVGVTGIVVTKLDGTARGGVMLAIEDELGVPVKLVGVGEGVGDLLAFSPDEYAEELVSP